MTGTRAFVRVGVCVVVVAATAVACGGSDKPAVCGDADQLRSSVQALRDVKLEQGAVAKLKDDAAQVRQDLTRLEGDAKAQFAAQITALRTALTSLSTSLEAASAGPTAVSLAAVGVATRETVDAGRALVTAVDDTC